WGQAVVPPEYAALAVGRARAVRRYQNRRLFPLLPLIPALQAVNFAFSGMIQKSGVSYMDELKHQLVHPWFWINVAGAVVIFPIWQRVASYRSERLNRAQIEQAPAAEPVPPEVASAVAATDGQSASNFLTFHNIDAGYGHLQ